MTPSFITATGMILLATAATLIPHPPNFSPAAAIALFAGAHFADKRSAFGVPLLVLFLRDLFVGLHLLMPWVYASYLVSVCLGLWIKRSSSAPRIAVASVLGSVQFFLITNFAVWLLLKTFPQMPGGLAACYIAGLPHFGNALLGDLLFTAAMFGIYTLAQRRLNLSPARA